MTRGAMRTPEQTIPGQIFDEPWESCITTGEAWQYQPQNERYKTGHQLIRLLIETRAKGGNLLLNVGPKPNGELAIEQEERLRELGLWMFVNSEAIYGVRPWVITNEGDVWFTKKKDSSALYAIVDPATPWKMGDWKDVVLHSVKATAKTEVSVLGANGEVLEYAPKVTPKTTFRMEADGPAYSHDEVAEAAGQSAMAEPCGAASDERRAGAGTAKCADGGVLGGTRGRGTITWRAICSTWEEQLRCRWDSSTARSEERIFTHGQLPWVAMPVQTVNHAGKFSAELTGTAGLRATMNFELSSGIHF